MFGHFSGLVSMMAKDQGATLSFRLRAAPRETEETWKGQETGRGGGWGPTQAAARA